MSARLAVVGRLDGLVVRHFTALQPDASCGDPSATYPYASGQNRNGHPTFGLTNVELWLQSAARPVRVFLAAFKAGWRSPAAAVLA
jgi:hypothetical protein